MLYRKHGHLQAESFSHPNYTRDKRDRKSASSYSTYVGGNLITYSKKQSVVSHSSTKVEYIAIGHTCDMMWLKFLS